MTKPKSRLALLEARLAAAESRIVVLEAGFIALPSQAPPLYPGLPFVVTWASGDEDSPDFVSPAVVALRERDWQRVGRGDYTP